MASSRPKPPPLLLGQQVDNPQCEDLGDSWSDACYKLSGKGESYVTADWHTTPGRTCDASWNIAPHIETKFEMEFYRGAAQGSLSKAEQAVKDSHAGHGLFSLPRCRTALHYFDVRIDQV